MWRGVSTLARRLPKRITTKEHILGPSSPLSPTLSSPLSPLKFFESDPFEKQSDPDVSLIDKFFLDTHESATENNHQEQALTTEQKSCLSTQPTPGSSGMKQQQQKKIPFTFAEEKVMMPQQQQKKQEVGATSSTLLSQLGLSNAERNSNNKTTLGSGASKNSDSKQEKQENKHAPDIETYSPNAIRMSIINR